MAGGHRQHYTTHKIARRKCKCGKDKTIEYEERWESDCKSI